MRSARLDSQLPRSVPAGSAHALYCVGTAPASEGKLELVLDGAACAPEAVAMPRFDLPERRCGFWGVIPFRAPDAPGVVRLRARDASGEYELGTIEVVAPAPRPSARDGLIAICMATYDPDPELLRAQLDSLRAQTDTRWLCVISDDRSSSERYAGLETLVAGDERFVLSRSERKLGFYRNFERALRLAPADAELIALCDQDDVWHADKLATLRRALGGAALVYSDQRLTRPDGTVLRETLWRGRANNWTNLASMLIANTVTGAAVLMRREVAELALPFPETGSIQFHDHWIALVALACGDLAYVPRPLYDYVQHGGAVLGKVAAEDRAGRALRLPRMRAWRAAYFCGYQPGRVRALTLLLRCGHRLTPAKRRALKRYLTAESSAASLCWLALRPLRALAGRSETLAGEWELLPGLVWRALAGVLAALPWWPERWLLDTRFPDPPVFEQKRLRRWRSRV